MPTCRVCRRHVAVFESAALFRWEHKACKDEREAEERREREALARLTQQARDAVLDAGLLEELDEALDEAALSGAARDRLLVGAFEHSVDVALDDGILSREEEHAVGSFRAHFELGGEELDRSGLWTKTVEAAVLRDVMEGKLPDEPRVGGHVPFNLMKSEDLVWVIPDAAYYQTKTVREFRGSSHGVSIRVAKGLYYRPSAFRGRSVSREETVHADNGMLGVTTKHIYFHGERERFRVRYDRIVSFEPFSDGLGIMRDNQRAKPESFVTGDGWFIYNLVTNLSQL